jgi:hypothetical protein
MEAVQKELDTIRIRRAIVQEQLNQSFREWKDLKKFIEEKTVTRSMIGLVEDLATLEYNAAIAQSEIEELNGTEAILIKKLRENTPEMMRFFDQCAEAWREGKPLPKPPCSIDWASLKPLAE